MKMIKKINYTFSVFDKFQLQLQRHYDAAIVDGNDDSTTSK